MRIIIIFMNVGNVKSPLSAALRSRIGQDWSKL